MQRRKAKIELTLFPFLSVLAGLIAVLMLFLIVIIATRVFADVIPEEPSPSPVEGPVVDEDQYQELIKRLASLRSRLEQRWQEQAELLEKQQQLADLLKAKQIERALSSRSVETRKVGVELGKPEAVVMVPKRGASVREKAIFLEVSAASCVIHPEGRVFPVTLDADGKYKVPHDFAAFLASVDVRRSDEYIVFLIHPNGFPAWDGITDHLFAKHRELKLGWEPFSRDWEMIAKGRK